MTEISLKDNIKNIGLPKLLAYLNQNRKTGTLEVQTPIFTKRVYLVKGDAIFASSTYEDDRLGEMLIKSGKITLDQYEKSVERLKKTGKRQGAILVDLGYITPKDLFWGVKYQVKEIIHSLFQIEDAPYEFIEGGIPTNEVITLKMSMGNLIYEGVKRIDNWTRIRNEMPAAEAIFKLSSNPATLFQDVELSEQDRKMLAMVDGTRSIKELIDSSWFGSFEAMKILYVLWSIGVVEQMKEPEEQVVQEQVIREEILQPVSASAKENSFSKRVDEIYSKLGNLSAKELLEINEDSDEDAVVRNYYRLSKEFHPDRCFSSGVSSMKDKLTAIFDAITQAYNVLQDSATFKEMTEPINLEQELQVSEIEGAEKQFIRGIEEFKKGNFWEAVDSFRGATKLQPNNSKYWSHLSLSLTKIPNGLKDAEKALFEALKIEPDKTDHYINLGMIYIKAGMKKKANSEFKKALEIDPDNPRAKRGFEKTKA
ncbi:MAG: DUF4388 domain-containing protein [Nitrospirota bacterium]